MSVCVIWPPEFPRFEILRRVRRNVNAKLGLLDGPRCATNALQRIIIIFPVPRFFYLGIDAIVSMQITNLQKREWRATAPRAKHFHTVLLATVALVAIFLATFAPVAKLSMNSKETTVLINERPDVLPSNTSDIIGQTPPLPVLNVQQKRIIYSNPRRDRSGAALQDMMLAHAHAWHHGFEYGGVCGETARTEDHKAFVKALGLDNVLPFACPVSAHNATKDLIVPREVYYERDTKSWTPDWLAYIRSKVKHSADPSTAFHIVVHVRRGDVNLFSRDKDISKRYLPNSHYLQLNQDYWPSNSLKPVQVTIFTEDTDEGHEPLSDFSEYRIDTDLDLAHIWRSIMAADVFIMSKSSFSLVPAALNQFGRIVYTPFMHMPFPGWAVVSMERVHAAEKETRRLRSEKCI